MEYIINSSGEGESEEEREEKKEKKIGDPKSKKETQKKRPKIRKGEQIFIHYGNFSNTKLLKVYGFCMKENINDHIEIYSEMRESAPLFNQKIDLLRKFEIGPFSSSSSSSLLSPSPFYITREGIPGSLFVQTRIQCIQEENDKRALLWRGFLFFFFSFSFSFSFFFFLFSFIFFSF